MAEFGSTNLVLASSPAVMLRVGVFGDRGDSLVVMLDDAAVRGPQSDIKPTGFWKARIVAVETQYWSAFRILSRKMQEPE